MRTRITRWRALANLVAAAAVVAAAGYGLSRVAARQWRWRETFPARARFATIAGAKVGDRVRFQGIDAGVVESIAPPDRPGGDVTLALRLDTALRHLVRADATARIASEGVVGAKFVEVVPGQPDAPPLPQGAFLRSERPVELADLLKDAQASLRRVDAAVAAAEKGLGEANAIASAIAKGEGTVGKLVRDDEAYRRLVAMSTRGERTLVDLEENLAALKRTWPLSRYFDGRGFDDRDRVLFQPGAERDSRSLAGDDLFEPGRSVLTLNGRRRLDEVAAWAKSAFRGASEVVVAAYTDEPGEPERARILTQAQADSVRKYLIARHKLDSIGWFGSRKVAAVGFGNQVPRDAIGQGPARRVEVIVFTPQT